MPRIGAPSSAAGLSSGYPLWFASRWNFPPFTGSFAAHTPNTTSTIGYLVRVPNPCTISQIGIVCTSGVSGGWTMPVALYESSADPRPTTLIPSATTTFDLTSAATKTFTLGTPYVVTAPRHIWVLYQSSTANPAGGAINGYNPQATYSAGNPAAVSGPFRSFSGNPTPGTADISSATTTQSATTITSGVGVYFYCSAATV